jgi:LuxR family maltose regulon positive regulatory protein
MAEFRGDLAVKPAPTLAKLSRPRQFDTIPRERLFERLDGQQALPVTLVAAPPGAGKTTLVASWLESRKLGGIWYQVDAGDADPATFFHFLGMAERALPGRPRGLPPLPPLSPEYMADLDGFSRRFFRTLFARLKPPATLVFDNFQEAGDEGPLHAVLVSAIEEVPRGVHLFLVSRHPPPDRYARLAANRSMGLVDWDEIKLTAEETTAIVGAAALPLDPHVAASLHARSGGWAAGLVLLAEHFRRGHAPQSVGDPDSLAQVFAYFTGQLFDQAPAEDRRMLVALSFLPSASEAMALKLTGSEAVVSLLERLYRRHLFTDRRQGTERVYTFHALFRAFLQHRADTELTLAERVDLARRAAELLDAAGQSDAAMPLYVSVGDFDAAEALVQREAPALIGQGRWKVVVDWIDALPRERVADSPWLLHWRGTARIGVDPASARVVLEQAHALATQKHDELCQVLCAAGMVETYFLEYSVFMPVTPWIAGLEHMFSLGFRFPNVESELRASSAMLIAATYREPDHPQIERCAERVRVLLAMDIDVNLRVSAGSFLTIYEIGRAHV